MMTERREEERREETPVEMSARRQKNPAKVAAGKKSAENRRKRQEEAEARHEDVASRLARLEEAKRVMHSELVDDDGTSEETIQLAELKEPEQPITIVTKDPPASGWSIETIVVGGLGLAVIAHMVYTTHVSKAQAPKAGVARKNPSENSCALSTAVRQPPRELCQRDPFYME